MTDWLRTYLAPLPLTSYSLAGLFLLAALEFLGWRQPIRDGLATGWAWLIAKALALRSLVAAFGREVRDFWRWVVNPAPRCEPLIAYTDEEMEHYRKLTAKDSCDCPSVGGFLSACKDLGGEAVDLCPRNAPAVPRRPRRKRRPKKDA